MNFESDQWSDKINFADGMRIIKSKQADKAIRDEILWFVDRAVRRIIDRHVAPDMYAHAIEEWDKTMLSLFREE